MSINPHDGNWGLDFWVSEASYLNDDEAQECYASTEMEARDEAKRILTAGRYKFIVLSRWNYTEQDWDEVETLTPEDLED
ncbi:hypothetical protein KUV46_05650 [Thalassovita mediterranea]|nr:hypothetical protein KUV46_05650 [Thalassovita mediterranea]